MKLTVESFAKYQHIRTWLDNQRTDGLYCGTLEYIYMSCVMFSSPAIIDGVLCFELPTPLSLTVQYMFFGYHCNTCKKIFLVKEDWTEETLHASLKHKCMPT